MITRRITIVLVCHTKDNAVRDRFYCKPHGTVLVGLAPGMELAIRALTSRAVITLGDKDAR